MPRKKKAVIQSTGGGTWGRRGRPPKALTTGAMGGAVDSLRKIAAELATQRTQIDQQLLAVQNALAVMGAAAPRIPARGPLGRAAGAAAGGGPRPGSLKDHILRVLRGGGVMSVKDITDGVVAGGYQSANKTLAKSVGIALTELSNVKKVARGKFGLK